ncbi:hypothetical protein Hypma_008283 [Hypsizygus marmoreus]|uniref:Uncharacterized protein n=1 Tax=Hypsizygus marmoreus TaxID=39966 RepID=A0A151V5F0_HYPMA|nr:hypothetical protein Hypma_008289 [Hypsizygus marmoreus]RDB24546.1 hypothetical protein Hypma_008283 [Hypsizygus marmoreus]
MALTPQRPRIAHAIRATTASAHELSTAPNPPTISILVSSQYFVFALEMYDLSGFPLIVEPTNRFRLASYMPTRGTQR